MNFLFLLSIYITGDLELIRGIQIRVRKENKECPVLIIWQLFLVKHEWFYHGLAHWWSYCRYKRWSRTTLRQIDGKEKP